MAVLEFTGDINVGEVSCQLSYACADNRFKGFNLIGNPYPHNIYKGANDAAIPNGDLLEDKYCVLGVNGNWVLTDDGTAIKPGTAILVQAKASGNLTMHDVTTGGTSKRADNNNIWFSVSNSDYEDVACVEFREGRGFNKMAHYNEDAPMLYISHNDENFASADINGNVHLIDLCFKAKTMGQYTLKLNVNGDFSYMHLVDKLTGDDTDMLMENSYTFVGTPGDRLDRFVLRLDYNAGHSTDSETFAYQSGSDIIVSGEGELQVFDVTGRNVMTTMINGVESVSFSAKGVYVFRLVGETIKTQKIVIR